MNILYKFSIFSLILVSSAFVYNYMSHPFDYMHAVSPYVRNIGLHKPTLYRYIVNQEPFSAYTCAYYCTRLLYEPYYLFDRNGSMVFSFGQFLSIGSPIRIESTEQYNVYQYTFSTHSHIYCIQETPNCFGGYNYTVCSCDQYGHMKRSYYIGVFNTDKRLYCFFETQQPLYWFDCLKKD